MACAGDLRSLWAVVNPPFAGDASSMGGRPRSGRLLVAGVATIALLAACTGDDDSAPGTTVPPPTLDTTFVTTTAPSSPPSTGSQVTDRPSTTLSTDATTTVAETGPTVTSAIADPEVQAVVDAARASWSAYIDAIRDPGNEETLLELAETKRDDALDSAVGIVQELIASNQRAVESPDVPTAFVARPESVQIDGPSAIIEYCWVGSDIIVEMGGNDDGSDRVVNDDIVIFVERERFELIDDRWRKVGGDVLQQIEGETSCDGFV